MLQSIITICEFDFFNEHGYGRKEEIKETLSYQFRTNKQKDFRRKTYTSNVPLVPVLVGELQTRSQYLHEVENILLLGTPNEVP